MDFAVNPDVGSYIATSYHPDPQTVLNNYMYSDSSPLLGIRMAWAKNMIRFPGSISLDRLDDINPGPICSFMTPADPR